MQQVGGRYWGEGGDVGAMAIPHGEDVVGWGVMVMRRIMTDAHLCNKDECWCDSRKPLRVVPLIKSIEVFRGRNSIPRLIYIDHSEGGFQPVLPA